MRIAVTGATGYVGGRLVPLLVDAGHDVVCLARNPDKIGSRPWRPSVEVRQCNVLDFTSVDDALSDCDAAYYLIHSMGGHGDFAVTDRIGAENFARAAASNGLQRIVYLGGLAHGKELSRHLSSRQEVGRVLAGGTTPVTELRAGIVIGSGSVSFEMLRHLTEVLPVMVTPRWVDTLTQPIAIRDVLAFLLAALDDQDGNHVYEIGGPDVVSYRDMMQRYARVAGLRRRVVLSVPMLTPRLSSLWIGLVTPLPIGVARPLVDSLRNEVTVRDRSAERFGIHPMSLDEAIGRALDQSNVLDVPSRWSDASPGPARTLPWDPEWSGGTLFSDRQDVVTSASAADLYWAFARIGGRVGYYTQDWAWRLRGLLDILVGGVGLRRGRRHPEEVRLGETIDFWRVAAVTPDSMLQLSAEMRLPGEAWLEWNIEPTGDLCTLHQTAYFRPRGLAGRMYWYAMLPFHAVIFRRMAEAIVQAAETRVSPQSSD
ncbi:MAG TPA: SDR family oxidoreductase [Acidimicrobiia bacterium]|nr:SDR family oxidoreductase [Acidimicrobiia bacterium]